MSQWYLDILILPRFQFLHTYSYLSRSRPSEEPASFAPCVISHAHVLRPRYFFCRCVGYRRTNSDAAFPSVRVCHACSSHNA